MRKIKTKAQGSSIGFTSVRFSGDGRDDSLRLLLNSHPLLNIFDMLVTSYAYIFFRDP